MSKTASDRNNYLTKRLGRLTVAEMAKKADLLERMRRNPASDWMISDVLTVCGQYDIPYRAPGGGSHYTIYHESQPTILTIPAARPILAVYIRGLVKFIAKVGEADGPV